MPLISAFVDMPVTAACYFESGNAKTLRCKSEFDNSKHSQVRVLLSKPQKMDVMSVLSLLSSYGEIQCVDISTHQVDSSVSVSYFDCRAASVARMSLVQTPIPGICLNSEPSFPVPFCSSHVARSVVVVADSDCNNFLHSVFDRFGEVDKIEHKTNEYWVHFFDARSPLSVKRAITPTEAVDWTQQVTVSSDQLISLLLTGTDVSPDTPQSSSSTKPTNEFLINLRAVDDARTTVMIRNIPKTFSQSLLVELLSSKLSPDSFDFLYLPMDLMNGVNVGYAFVNLRESCLVVRVFNLLNNKNWRMILSQCAMAFPDSSELHKACKVSYGRIQGLANLMEHFKSSSIMNQPDSIRPYFA